MRLISDDAVAITTIFIEAEGELMDGKIAVGEVIRTRMRKKFFSDGTVIGTCLRPAQFSGWNSNSANRIRSLKIDTESRIVNDCAVAWELSRTSNLTAGAVYYLNPELTLRLYGRLPGWAAPSKQLAVVGNHHFFAA